MQYVQISAVFQVAITTVLVSWLPPTLTKREGWKSTATVWVAHLKEGELPLQAQQLCWAQEQPTWQKQGCRHHSKAVFSRSGSPLLAITLLLLTHLESQWNHCHAVKRNTFYLLQHGKWYENLYRIYITTSPHSPSDGSTPRKRGRCMTMIFVGLGGRWRRGSLQPTKSMLLLSKGQM